MSEPHVRSADRAARRPVRPIGIATVLLVGTTAPLAAHPGGAGDFAGGLLHPLLGADHVAAMVVIGLLAVAGRSRPLLRVPATFLGFAAVGFAMGVVGGLPAGPEAAVPLSLVALGGATALRSRAGAGPGRASLLPVLCLVALAGGAHGLAHGAGITSGSAVATGAGVLLTTLVLHLGGIVAGIGVAERGRPALAPLLGCGAVAFGLVALLA